MSKSIAMVVLGVGAMLLAAMLTACQDDAQSVRDANQTPAAATEEGTQLSAEIQATELQDGDCVNSTIPEGISVDAVVIVPCSGDWQYRVLSSFQLADAEAYPGQDFIDEQAVENCHPLTTIYLYPLADSWGSAARTVTCLQAASAATPATPTPEPTVSPTTVPTNTPEPEPATTPTSEQAAERQIVESLFGDMLIFRDPSGHFEVEVPAGWVEEAPDPSLLQLFKASDAQGSSVVIQVAEFPGSMDDYAGVVESHFIDQGVSGYIIQPVETAQGIPGLLTESSMDGITTFAFAHLSDGGALVLISYNFPSNQSDAGGELAYYSFGTFLVN